MVDRYMTALEQAVSDFALSRVFLGTPEQRPPAEALLLKQVSALPADVQQAFIVLERGQWAGSWDELIATACAMGGDD